MDGIVHYTYNPPIKDSNTWPFDAEQFLLLNLAIASDISPTFQQGTLEIDYVRVFEPSTDPAGCMDVNATNYDSAATIQEYDQWGNILCDYASCDDIPDFGCIYADGFGAFNEGFDASDCETYGGIPCEEDILGCTDINANNYNVEANLDDGSCEFPEPVSGIVFSGVFGGTFAEDNTYTMPSGSESWAGFANEDASIYPLTFGEGGSITFTGSTDGSSADIYFRFEFNPYPDTEPSYNTTSVTLGPNSEEYTVNIPSTGGDSFSSFLLYVTTTDVAVTLGNVVVNTSDYSGPVDIVGCMDANATNYNAAATEQGYDQWGNLQCVYASCDDIPEFGCIYPDGFGAFNEGFDAAACSSYGGTPCEEASGDISGCTDSDASNYNAAATVDDGSCEYSNTDPVSGIVFSGTFGGTFAEGNTYTMPSGSESWAGFANEDASVYPLTFGEGGSITFTGSTDGSSADIYFRFEFNPYPDTEPSYNTTSVTLGPNSEEYTVNIPSTGGDSFSSFLLYVTTTDVAVTLGNVVVNTSDYSGPVDIVGCMDANATNYNAAATEQGYDQWGNLQCVYASCDDIPEFGCIYPDGFGAFNEGFDAAACSSYGGTPCEEASGDISGCTDSDASNYNAAATVDDGSCEYTEENFILCRISLSF